MTGLTPQAKKTITLLSMAVLVMFNLKWLVNIKMGLPLMMTNAMFGVISLVNIAAIGAAVGIYWIATKQI